MAVTRVDSLQSSKTTPISVTTALEPGDVVVLIELCNNPPQATSLSGLGATWTKEYDRTPPDMASSKHRVAVWVGRGGTGTGDITWVLEDEIPVFDMSFYGYILRGSDGHIVSITDQYSPSGSGGANPLESPHITLRDGQAVFYASINNSGTLSNNTSSFTGTWTSGVNGTGYDLGGWVTTRYNLALGTLDGQEVYGVASFNGDYDRTIVQIVIGREDFGFKFNGALEANALIDTAIRVPLDPLDMVGTAVMEMDATYGTLSMTMTGGPTSMQMDSTGFVPLAMTMTGQQSVMTARIPRQWVKNPGLNKPDYRVVLKDVAGNRYGELENASLGPMSWELNNTGSFSFSLPNNDPKNRLITPIKREVEIWRGREVVWAGVILSANPDDSSVITYECATLDWYFLRRVIGLVPTPNLLKNGSFEEGLKHWEFTYSPGSIPAAPPLHRIIQASEDEDSSRTINGQQALEIEGAASVQMEKEVTTTKTVLGSDVAFARGTWSLTSSGQSEIRNLLDKIKPGAFKMTVEGHTDSEPYTSHPGGNQWLSQQRADAVASYIRSRRSDATVTAIGRGSTRPVASNATASGRAANRRVEIYYSETITTTVIVEAKGHRQYAHQKIRVTQPESAKKRITLTLVGWCNITEFEDSSKDGFGVYMERVSPSGKVMGTSFVPINSETPRNRWTRMECSITVPSNGLEYTVDVRLYPPAGVCRWDEISVTRSDQLGFFDREQAFILKTLINHLQDPDMGKSDLRLTPNVFKTGKKRTREYPFSERLEGWEAIYEFPTLADGMDITVDVTPEERFITSHYPRKARKNPEPLALGKNILSYGIQVDGTYTSSTIIVQSEGEGSDREEGVVQDARHLDGLVLEMVYNATPGSAISSLQKQAERGLKRYRKPVTIPDVTMRPDLTSDLLDTYELGDIVRVHIQDNRVSVDDNYRIIGMTLDPVSDTLSYIVNPEDDE